MTDWLAITPENIPEIAAGLAKEQRERAVRELALQFPEASLATRERMADQVFETAVRVYEADLAAGFAQHLMREGKLN